MFCCNFRGRHIVSGVTFIVWLTYCFWICLIPVVGFFGRKIASLVALGVVFSPSSNFVVVDVDDDTENEKSPELLSSPALFSSYFAYNPTLFYLPLVSPRSSLRRRSERRSLILVHSCRPPLLLQSWSEHCLRCLIRICHPHRHRRHAHSCHPLSPPTLWY